MKKKRILSVLLALAMVLTLLPATSLAADAGVLSYAGFRAVASSSSGTQSYNCSNAMWVKISGKNSEAVPYDITYTAPEGTEKKVTKFEEFENPSGFYVSYVRWQIPQDELKSGIWTVKAYDTGYATEETHLKGTVQISMSKVVFHPNGGTITDPHPFGNDYWDESKETKYSVNGGKLVNSSDEGINCNNCNGKQHYVSYVGGSDFIFNIAAISVKKENSEDSFLYWSKSSENPEKLHNSTVFAKDGDTIDLYANYGTLPTHTYEFKNGETLVQGNGELLELPQMEYGDTPGTSKLTLTYQYTGNTDTSLALIPTGNFDIVVKRADDSKNGEVYTERPIKLSSDPKDENTLSSFTMEITPKANLPVGTHTGQLQFRLYADHVIRCIKYSVNVINAEQNVKATLTGNPTKHYGETLTAAQLAEQVTIKTTPEKDFGSLGYTLHSAGMTADAAVGEYEITLEGSNQNCTVTLEEGAPKLKVEKATPEQHDLHATGVKIGAVLSSSTLTGKFVNPYTNEEVKGTLEWSNPSDSVGNTAGTVQKQWKFTPEDTKNYNEATGEVNVEVSNLDPTELVLKSDQKITVVYDGQEHTLEFEAQRGGSTVTEGITVQYRRHEDNQADDIGWSDAKPKAAGTYDVKATIPADASNASDDHTVILTIEKRTVGLEYSAAEKTYDGNTNAKVTVNITNAVEGDTVSIAGSTGVFDSKDVGEHKQVTITLGTLEGESKDNYQLPATVTYHTNADVKQKEVKLTAKADGLTKVYGAISVIGMNQFNVEGLVEGDNLDYVVFNSDGCASTAEVGDYPVTISTHGGNYNVTFDGTAPHLTVEKAKAVADSTTFQTSAGKKGGNIAKVTMQGVVHNENNRDMTVEGTWALSYNGALPSAETCEVDWTFTPNEEYKKNYTFENDGVLTGKVTINLVDKEPVAFEKVENQTVTYTGETQAYDAENLVQITPAGEITLMYKLHIDTEGHNTPTAAEDWAAWTENAPKDAGIYDVMIAAQPTDTDNYAGNSIIVHLVIEPARPVVTINTKIEEGTSLSDVQYTVAGVNNETPEGSLTWQAPLESVVNAGEDYTWTFVSASANYGSVTGSAVFTYQPDDRDIASVTTIYNLPDESGYEDYAVLDLSEVKLKAGETVQFYKDKEYQDPVSEVYTAVGTESEAVIKLDADALDSESGEIYVDITNKSTISPKPVRYDAEPGFTIGDLMVKAGDTIPVTVSGYDYTSVNVALADETVAAVEGNDTRNVSIKGLAVGSTSAAIKITFDHPDTVRHSGEHITVTKTVEVTVTVLPVITITAEDITTTYGTEYDVAVKTDPENAQVTIKYAPKGSEDWTDTAPVNAGSYEVQITAAKEGYVTVQKVVTLEIRKADALSGLTVQRELRYDSKETQTVTAQDLVSAFGDRGLGSVTITGAVISAGENILETAEYTADKITYRLKSDLGSETVGQTAAISVTFESTNYETTTLNLTVKLIDKSSSGESGGGSSGGSGGGTVAPAPAPQENATLTPRVTPDANGEAKAEIKDSAVSSGIQDAKEASEDALVVAPQVEGDASKVSVELSKAAVGQVANAGLDLTVKTGLCSVTLRTPALEDLAEKSGSTVTVSVEAGTNGETTVTVMVGDTMAAQVSGGFTVEMPAKDGNVLVTVDADGKETVVRKSLVESGRVFAVLDGSCTVKVVDKSKDFADVASGDWFSGAVDFANSHALFNGLSRTEFAPNAPMTRSMLATVLWRLEKEPDAGIDVVFADVEANTWYTTGVAWANANGIVKGYSSSTFGPEDDVTREDLAVMLHRYAQRFGLDTSASGSLSRFSDSGMADGYAVGSLEWVVGTGLMEGKNGGLLDPTGKTTRAEVATILQRLVKLIVS